MSRSFFCGILLVLSLSVSYSQAPDLRFVDPLEFFDLPDNTVTCIGQDSTGFIWIGTGSGLCRYDGYELKTYRYRTGDTTSLVNNIVTTLFVDSKSRLWVGTHQGLCIYQPEYDNFIWIFHMHSVPELKNLGITDINEGPDGNIYVANVSEIYRIKTESKQVENVLRIDKGDISSFLFDRKGNIWIAAFKEGGLVRFDALSGEKKVFLHDPARNSITSNSVVDLALQGGLLWIATYNGGINCYDTEKGEFRSFKTQNIYELSGRSVYTDSKGLLWATDVTGLKVFNPATNSFTGYYPTACDRMSIKINCSGIFEDRDGNYWTLHAGKGLALSVVPKGFKSFNNDPNAYWHLSEEEVSAICEDSSARLWMGNPHNGIDIFDWQTGEIVTYIHNPSDSYSIGRGAVFSIFRDSDNRIWTGTNMGGLQYFDQTKGRFNSFINNPLDTSSIANNDIRSIDEDENGNLWVVVHGKGIDRFDRKKNIFTHFTSHNSGLSNDYCFQALADSKGNIWVATVWGLSLLRKGEKRFVTYYQEESDTTSLSDNMVICLHEDDKGNIWIGTANGLNRYNSDRDNFTRFMKGFANTKINSLSSDAEGLIWAGTSKGISVLNPGTGLCRNFDTHDGLLSLEYYPRAVYRNTGKDIFLGGHGGLTIVAPDKLVYKKDPPKVIISGFDIINTNISEEKERKILDKNISYTRSITLDYSYNDITISYAAFDFSGPLRNQYKYKLEGYNQDWVYAGSKREVTFTNLDPKRYIFRVQAGNSDGYWNTIGASIEIIIKPPWFKTIAFKVSFTVFLIAIVTAIIFFRTRNLQKQKVLLERQIKDRTQELSEKNILLQKQTSDLNNANLELTEANTTKDKLFSIIAHDIINPFNTLLGFSDVLREDFHKINDEEKMEIIRMIGTSSDRIHDLLENLLKWARTKSGKMTVIKRVFRIKPMIDSAIGVYELAARNKNITVKLDIAEEIQVFADEDMTSTIIRNLLNNAIKFTPEGGAITVSAIQKEDKTTIIVTDNGIGIKEKMAESLFSTHLNDTQGGQGSDKGSGLGLIICKEFTDINNGEISVQSEPGKGSSFYVTLPAFE